ncbi:Protein FAM169B [Takifugu flavidus]|uniref:Protein FAM169B n=1 Tax=Takifugu flavidus TaxID=433684 RepID=A0A5C6PJD5_9TELE|nr:Protein FAM169B [Takifugu flavidus]
MKATHALQRATRAALKSRMRLWTRGLPTPAVDLPVVGDTDLTLASEQYLSSLEQMPHKTKEFQSSTTNKVQSIVERVIVFLLSRVVNRSLDESMCFSLHPRTESCSLLWRDGQAIGFYTVKHKGVMVGVGGKRQFYSLSQRRQPLGHLEWSVLLAAWVWTRLVQSLT